MLIEENKKIRNIIIGLISIVLFVNCSTSVLTKQNRAARDSKSNENTASTNPLQKGTADETVIDTTTASENAENPEALLRRFYDWYLGEVKKGKQPWGDQATLRNYLSDECIQELKDEKSPADFDHVLGLPKPESAWFDMRVEFGKTEYFHKKGLYDAYIRVTYKDFKDRLAETRKGFASIVDQWSIGFTKTANGWRIASIGVDDI